MQLMKYIFAFLLALNGLSDKNVFGISNIEIKNK